MARSFETGGEVLQVGSTVILFDGNSQKEAEITDIGTKRVFISSPYGFRPVPFSRETRQSLQGAYTVYFKTRTEVAEEQKRALVKSRLRDLGVEARLAGSGRDGLDPYSVETLREVADLLESKLPNGLEIQQG